MMNERLLLRSEFTLSAIIFNALIFSSEFDLLRMYNFGFSIVICKISLRFFSSSEKLTFIERVNKFFGIFRRAIFFFIKF